MRNKITQLLQDISAGSYAALARAITIVENDLPGYDRLLLELPYSTQAKVVGITGPPGAGKSTLVNALLGNWLDKDNKVAVVAVDPSSPFNYGALLGDRIRMSSYYNNNNVYIRSLASRGALGGLSAKMLEIADVVKTAPFDYILIETVGVGQSEVEIAGLADCTVVALVPEAGDEVQTLKAGIMEIADVFVVNKADREMADALYRNLRILTHEKAGAGEEIAVVKTVATTGSGVEELARQIDHWLGRQRQPEKKIQMLAEKSWHLIQSGRMKDIRKADLVKTIAKLVDQPDFNLYRFVQSRMFVS